MAVDDPTVIELREWSRMAEDLGQERNRLANRIGQQLWRYYPQMLHVADDLAAENFLALWELAPTPAKAARIDEASLAKVLKAHRVRRIGAGETLRILRQEPLQVAPGAAEAAAAHIELAAERARLVNRQIREAEQKLDTLCARLEEPSDGERESEPGQRSEQCDVTILRSLPGGAGGGKDQSRRAARRGHRALAPPRLSDLADFVRRRPGHPPERQGAPRVAPLGLQPASARGRLSLGPRGDADRSGKQEALC
jgi:hypothetical protein